MDRLRLVLLLALAATPALHAHAAEDDVRAGDDDDAATLKAVEVNAALDRSRAQLSPDIGASQYVLDSRAIEQLPLGDATPFNQMLLQAPGVVQDSFGQLHIRGDHDDIQYRINGVTIPESIGGFGQALDPDMIQRVQLLTGALPAQYGYRTAGVVEITTESGARRHDGDDDDDEGGGAFGGRASVLAGAFGNVSPELSVHGSNERWSFFVTSEFQRNDVGIENPTARRDALHDRADEARTFGYLSCLLDDDLRLSLLFGGADNRFEIPNRPGEAARFVLAGAGDVDSATLARRQREITAFGTLSLQGKFAASDYQIALGQRYTSANFRPDPVGDLVFDGLAGAIDRNNRADTLQADVATPLGEAHTLRYGLYIGNEHPVSHTVARVFPADASGRQASDVPITIVDDAPRIDARTLGVYLQDQWNLTDTLTMNYGVRGDKVDAYLRESQLSPRVGIVHQAGDATTLHAGYARYFTPPPAELISSSDIALFHGTTNEQPGSANAQTLAERSHYFDAGVTRKFGAHLALGLDAYHRTVRNLLDEGEFGAAQVFAPFNYARGRVRGVEFTANYTNGGFSGYLNVATSRAMGRQVISGQFHFTPDELDYIAAHWVHLDHDQRLTGSGGVAYDWDGTKLGADFLSGSGMRADFANTAHLRGYYQLNLSANRDFALPQLGRCNARIALVNATDQSYALRDGSGIGAGEAQFGPRRGVYVVLSKGF